LKKYLFVFGLYLLSISLFSNDAPYILSGGNLFPMKDGDIDVIMKKEVITIDLYDEYFHVNVKFNFENEGDTQQLIVGFPFYSTGLGQAEIYDFRSSTNGVDTIAEENSISASGDSDLFKELGTAYTREVTFDADSITITEIEYNSTYGNSRYVSYLFGTGSFWSGVIEQIEIRINNHTDYWIYDMYMDGLSPERWNVSWEEDNFILRTGWIEPNETDCVKFQLENSYIYHQIMGLPMWYDHDSELLTEEDLRYLTSDQLRIVRNTIYAYNGYKFRDPELLEYFDVAWYEPKNVFLESYLNRYEKCNIEIISITESER